jgi:YfiH family protein
MVIRDPALDLTGIAHGFFTRRGGVSAGLYASLNCGPGSRDDAVAVAVNRDRVAQALGTGGLVSLYQVHGAEVLTLDRPPPDRPQADGMVTDRPGFALGILTADCAPILFADPVARVIGACHAGWRGALAGVWRRTVAAMTDLGARPARIRAVIGPTIAGRSYEVGPDFPRPFLDQDAANHRFFGPSDRAGHRRFDLPGYLRAGLGTLGLDAVVDSGEDTLTQPDRFFSYRRATLAGEPDYGRQVSAIALLP